MDIKFKAAIAPIKDVDGKGVVQFYASIFGNMDKYRDIVEPGAFKKTIKENFKEIQHYKNHDSYMMPGVVTDLKEDEKGLLVTSQLIMKTQLGQETYEEYKAMAEAGKSMFHSIGYYPIKSEKEVIKPAVGNQDEEAVWHLKEIFLREVSTLTAHPANDQALTVGIKSFENMDIEELLIEDHFYKNLLNSRFNKIELEKMEAIKNHITALIQERAGLTTPSKGQPLTKDEIINYFKII